MIHLFSHYVPVRVIVVAALEGVLLLAAAYAGIYLHLARSGPVPPHVVNELYAGVSLFVVGMMLLLASMGLYKPDLWPSKRSVALRICVAFGLAFMMMEFTSHVLPLSIPEPVEMTSVLALALVGSLVLRTVAHKWSKAAAFNSRVLVLGTGTRAMVIQEHAHLNVHDEVVGYVPVQAEKSYVPESLVINFAPGENLLSIVEKYAVDQIVIGIRDRRGGRLPVEQLLECRSRGVKVMEMPSFFEREYRQILLESLNPSWMVLGGGFRQDYLSNAVKRVFDLTASLTLLLVAWPVMLVTALCIYQESGGPVLFRQERVGKDGRAFNLLKFRSMRKDAEHDGKPQWARENDDRTTRIGRFIRKVRFDELPQLFNVLRGEMSFVGPRPERPFFVNQLSEQIPYYGLRHSAKPGITGWAQVRYPYGATIEDAIEKLQYDLYYVKNHSLFLDIMILISTVEVVLWRKGAR